MHWTQQVQTGYLNGDSDLLFARRMPIRLVKRKLPEVPPQARSQKVSGAPSPQSSTFGWLTFSLVLFLYNIIEI